MKYKLKSYVNFHGDIKSKFIDKLDFILFRTLGRSIKDESKLEDSICDVLTPLTRDQQLLYDINPYINFNNAKLNKMASRCFRIGQVL